MKTKTVEFWLVRDAKYRGGSYNLTSYLPFKHSQEDEFGTWWYVSPDSGHIQLPIPLKEAESLAARVGVNLAPSAALNLNTGVVTSLNKAPCLVL